MWTISMMVQMVAAVFEKVNTFSIGHNCDLCECDSHMLMNIWYWRTALAMKMWSLIPTFSQKEGLQIDPWPDLVHLEEKSTDDVAASSDSAIQASYSCVNENTLVVTSAERSSLTQVQATNNASENDLMYLSVPALALNVQVISTRNFEVNANTVVVNSSANMDTTVVTSAEGSSLTHEKALANGIFFLLQKD